MGEAARPERRHGRGQRGVDPLRGFIFVDPSGKREVTHLEAVGVYGSKKMG